jgi:hypothetical protein
MNGLAGETYVLEFSTNLADWAIVATNTAGLDGTVSWNIPAQSTTLKRFYRAIWR